jgi:hypothetical protein
MAEAAYTSDMMEAVAVFHDVKTFQAAIDELLLAGFDHADINVLAHDDAIASKLGPTYTSTAEFEDDPEAPRIAYIPDETIGNAEGHRRRCLSTRHIRQPCGGGIRRHAARRVCCGGDCRRRRRPDRSGTGTVYRPRACQAPR